MAVKFGSCSSQVYVNDRQNRKNYLRILEVTTLILNQSCLSLTKLSKIYKLATENITEIYVSLIGKDSER